MLLYVAFFHLSQQNNGKHMLLKMSIPIRIIEQKGGNCSEYGEDGIKRGLTNGAERILDQGTGCNRGRGLYQYMPSKDNNSGNSHSNSQTSL